VSVLVAGAPADTTRAVADELHFTSPPPGMMDLRHFTLTALDDAGFLFAMRSSEQDAIRLFVVPPRPYFPDYAPTIDGAALAALGTDADEVVLLVVVHPGQDDAPPTANLLAPVAVNPRTGAALQVVLDDVAWPLRAPLRTDDAAA
jgi:flagellar assembly factor FliW